MKKEIIVKDGRSSFSFKARFKSFRYAFEGVKSFFGSHHNAFIHLVITILVVGAAFYFKISRNEAIIIVLAAGFVWSAEFFNTAIEKMSDIISTEYHPGIKFIKDVSAAAVLISAFAALIIGAIIFLPKILV